MRNAVDALRAAADDEMLRADIGGDLGDALDARQFLRRTSGKMKLAPE